MSSIKIIEKFNKKFEKIGKDLIKNISTEEYIKNYGLFQPSVIGFEDKDLFVTTTYFSNISTRRTIVNTLKEINYIRKEDKWTEKIVVAFLEEVMNLYLTENNEDIIKEKEEEISKRYNVPCNRLRSQVALFILNLKKGHDNFNLNEYFSAYEITKWRYRDLNYIQKAIEEGTISEEDKEILSKLSIIE